MIFGQPPFPGRVPAVAETAADCRPPGGMVPAGLMPLQETSHFAGLLPRDRAVWALSLVPLFPLVLFGWGQTTFLPAALIGAGVALVASRLLGGRGDAARRAADALALAALLFPLAALAAGVLGQLLDFASGMQSPLAVNPIEGREAFKGWLLAHGRNIYAGPGPGRDILVTLYGPLYYILAALAERLGGPGLFQARLVSLGACAALLAAIFALVRRETGSVAAALCAACALFTTPLLEYGHFARPDMTAWAFFFLAAWAFTRALDAPHPVRPLAWAMVLAVCALLAKQQTWPPLFGLFLYGALRRRFGRTAAFALGTLLCGAAVFLAIDRATHGAFLFQTFGFPKRMAGLTDLNANAFALDRLRVFAGLYWRDLALLAGLLCSAVAMRRVTVVEPVLLACLAPLFVVLRWTGAEYNHFLPVVILAKAGGGILLARLVRRAASHGLGAPAAALVLALLVVPGEALPLRVARLLANQAGRVERLADLERDMDALPGPALSDAEAAYLFLGRPPRELTAYDAFETSIYERLGLLLPARTPLANAVRDRHFALVLTTPTFQPKALVSLLDLYYQATPTTVGPTLRRPRPEAAVLGLTLPGGPATQAGVTVAPVLDGLDVRPGFVTADGRPAPGRLTLDIRADRPLARLAVVFFPRLNLAAPASEIVLEAEDAGGSRTVLWSRKGGTGTGWTPEPGERTEVSVPASQAATVRHLVFTLRGPAQLWSDDAHPLLVAADPVHTGTP